MLGERFPQQILKPRLRLREGLGSGLAGAGLPWEPGFPAARALPGFQRGKLGEVERSTWRRPPFLQARLLPAAVWQKPRGQHS